LGPVTFAACAGVGALATVGAAGVAACTTDYAATQDLVVDAPDARDGAASDAFVARTVDAGGDGSAPPSWLLYTNFGQNGEVWGPPLELGAYFGPHPNAPPSSGIASATYVNAMDRLVIVTEAGIVHVRKGAAWLPPRTVSDVFSTMRGVTPRALWHLPLVDGGGASCTLTFSAPPNAYQFKYDDADLATPLGGAVPLSEGDGGGAPMQRSLPTRWDYEVVYNNTGTQPWAALFSAIGDDVWKLDTALVWTKTATNDFPLLKKAGAPPADRIREAFYDSAAQSLFMIVATQP
jgi:hypothetical protein